MSDQQESLIRNSLWNTVFADYNKLIHTIKTLPYDLTNPNIHKACSYIDDGVVWAKEVVMNSPLILNNAPAPAETEPTEECVATQDVMCEAI